MTGPDGPCAAAAGNFEFWLRFYTSLTDPKDLKTRMVNLKELVSFDGSRIRAVLQFRRGSTLALEWICVSGGPAAEPVVMNPADFLNRQVFEKNTVPDPSGPVCTGVFSPAGWPEPAGTVLETIFRESGRTVMLIDGKRIFMNDTDRIARCLKPLFVPWSVVEEVRKVREVIRELLERYIRIHGDTAAEAADVPLDLVMYTARQMAQENRCGIRKTAGGIDIVRAEV